MIDRARRSGAARELIIVGDGPLGVGSSAASTSSGCQDSVRIVGAVPRAEVITHLQQADVFALPVRTRLAGLNPEGLCLGRARGRGLRIAGDRR